MPGINWFDIAHYAIRARPDYSICVTHWTKDRDGLTAFNVLKRIIEQRRIIASTRESGFIKGDIPATCLTETPLTTMARAFLTANKEGEPVKYIKWAPYGLSFFKPVIYQQYGGRPVLYLSDDECDALCPVGTKQAKDFLWRVVRFDQKNQQEAIDFSHEREWRAPGNIDFSGLSKDIQPVVIVKSWSDVDELQKLYTDESKRPFRSVFCLSDLRILA